MPLHLRNAPTKLMQQMDYGKDYKYAHLGENNFVDLEFFQKPLKEQRYTPQATMPEKMKLEAF